MGHGARITPLPLVLAALVAAVPVAGQPPRPEAAPEAREQTLMHEQVQLLEQALTQAVNSSARAVELQLPSSAPGLVLFAGPIQVRGFRLPDYGLFFDVEFPVLRRSILWSMQRLDPFEMNMDAAFETLRRLQRMGDLGSSLEQALLDVEQGFRSATPASRVRFGGPLPTSASRRSDRNGETSVAPQVASADAGVDPQRAYHQALRVSLTDAILSYGGAVSAMLDEDEWLTVAARDVRSVSGRDGQIRIRAGDVNALREGRLTRPEARNRVESTGF